MSFKPIDIKRDEFRKYLERTGVLEAISKVFVKLLQTPDRPENALEFIHANLGASKEQSDSYQRLKLELEDARNEIASLKRTIEILQSEKSSSPPAVATPDDNNSNTNKSSVSNQDETKDENTSTANDVMNESTGTDKNEDSSKSNDENGKKSESVSEEEQQQQQQETSESEKN